MPYTRPDLCCIVTKLSQNMCDPTKAHLNMAKHVLRYLKGTLNIGLTFRKQKSEILGLQGFCDSDWGAPSDRRSITGYGFSLCKKGPLISWKSRKQQIVALSTCEAEYVALTSAIQEAKFLSQLLVDMNGGAKSKVILNVDNQGAICLAKNPVHHQRTKHIDIKYHYIRGEIQEGNVELKYVPSSDNIADLFTKPVSKDRLNKFSCMRGN